MENTVEKKTLSTCGYVEFVSADSIRGWAFNPNHPEQTVQIKVINSGKIIAECSTNFERKDVAASFGVPMAIAGFFIKLEFPWNDKEPLLVEARSEKLDKWVPLNTIKTLTQQKRGYQSFGDQLGASKSDEKLKALCLDRIARQLKTPNSGKGLLEGLSVLDIGCNEGYFCKFASSQGAKRVLGIDFNPHWISLAKQRSPDIEFRVSTWWDLDSEKFDVILFLSAIHYEQNQRGLLDFLRNRLTPNGILVLECGVAPGVSAWLSITRSGENMRYPSMKYLTETLLKNYSVRFISRSIMQAGDPIERFVFHCNRRKPTILLISDVADRGKSTLAKNIAHDRDTIIYKTDDLLLRLTTKPTLFSGSKLIPLLRENKITHLNLNLASSLILKNNLIDSFLDHIIRELPLDEDLFIIEGEALSHKAIHDKLIEKLSDFGIIWNISRATV
jgi:2-polyprenyl-3-methyl-5-hydroxy-6-metoxy-1,4-benzoquinol methylase